MLSPGEGAKGSAGRAMVFMVADIPARRRAAELIEAYLAGAVSGGELQEAWPTAEKDEALEKIGGELFRRLGGGRFAEEFDGAGEAGARDVLDRCRRFLGSEYPYAWGAVGAPGCLGVLLGVLLALLWLLTLEALVEEQWLMTVLLGVPAVLLMGLMINLHQDRGRMGPLTQGDLKCWPFERAEDMSAGADG